MEATGDVAERGAPPKENAVEEPGDPHGTSCRGSPVGDTSNSGSSASLSIRSEPLAATSVPAPPAGAMTSCTDSSNDELTVWTALCSNELMSTSDMASTRGQQDKT